MSNKFIGVLACVFDAYGTLFDVHSAVGKHRARLGDKAEAVSVAWRGKQLEYTWLRSIMDRYVDFWQITGDGLDFALETNGINDQALRDDLLNAYLTLDCYPEVPQVLSTLKDAGMQTAILSNGSPMMFGQSRERLPDGPHAEIKTLAELPAIVL
jgi:2-haloacid dehalogenase